MGRISPRGPPYLGGRNQGISWLDSRNRKGSAYTWQNNPGVYAHRASEQQRTDSLPGGGFGLQLSISGSPVCVGAFAGACVCARHHRRSQEGSWPSSTVALKGSWGSPGTGSTQVSRGCSGCPGWALLNFRNDQRGVFSGRRRQREK